jgi:hypothetical protein
LGCVGACSISLQWQSETHELKLAYVKARPTIADFNQSLTKAQVYDKMMAKNVDAMAAVGNEAAHNKPNLKPEDVERFRTNLVELLGRF